MEDEIGFTVNQRERDTRTALQNQATLGGDYQFVAQNAGADPGDGNGYWHGGDFVPFFRLGVSTFGDGSVLR